jgi:hypothetical protein
MFSTTELGTISIIRRIFQWGNGASGLPEAPHRTFLYRSAVSARFTVRRAG